MSTPSRRGGDGLLRRVWGSSLPLRIITTTLLASVVVLVLGGWWLVSRASEGILQGKREASIGQASVALQRMQSQLADTDLRTASLFERLNQLADEASSQRVQYRLVIEGPVSGYISRGINMVSVPAALSAAVGEGDGLYVTPTLVDYSDAAMTDEPGLAIGGLLHSPSGESFPVYFVFPLTQERATIDALTRSTASTGGLLLLGLAGVGYLVSRQIATPIRRASSVAGQIAAGDLDQRMVVIGTDDLASLATSMNNMASELQRKISQLEDLSRLQQRFVSDVSHELRTPLTTVRMAVEVLYSMRGDFEPTAARTTELLATQVDRFEGLLSDLLEISRFDAGAAELSAEPTQVADLVRAEIAAQAPFAERAGTPLTLQVLGDSTAEVDPRRIQRILRNLLTNAIEHGEQRPIDITVGADEHAVAVTVRDRGVGFTNAQSQLVFHRFWRADPSRNRQVGGSGLGLSISLEDANLHHGWLQAWGSPGRGAQFRLTVPRHVGDPVRTSPLPLRPTRPSPATPQLEPGSGVEA